MDDLRLTIPKSLKHWQWPYSFKHRLLAVLTLCSLVPLLLLGSMSHVSMYSILDNKAEGGLRGNLHQVRLSLDSTLSQLNHVSQLLAFDGRVGQSLGTYMHADIYDKKQLNDEIVNQMSLINFTNPALGLMFYYIEGTDEHLFANFPIKDISKIDRLPVLLQTAAITYYGPHESLNGLDDSLVLSIVRKVEIPERGDVNVYIETNFKLAESIINTEPFNADISHLIVDDMGKIVFSENDRHFPVGSAYRGEQGSRQVHDGYYLFEEESNQGWKVVEALPASAYKAEVNEWLGRFILLMMLSLAACFLFALLLWRSVYRPLRNLSREIREVKEYNLHYPPKLSRIEEFDTIHLEFHRMRERIIELIREVETKEQRKVEAEVEKLMNQINPHFLYNTLDTVRWLARLNGQAEIDRLASLLTSLLQYNLGKGGQALIRDELEALKTYVALQGIRYDFQFKMTVQADEETLDLPVPRFILQPLVENALYHGLDELEGGVIEVEVHKDGEKHVLLKVKDNGSGMDEEEFARMLRETDKPRKTGMGIGLHYVLRMIRHQYGEEADLLMERTEAGGAATVVRLPIERGSERGSKGASA